MKAIAVFLVFLFIGLFGLANTSQAYASESYKWTDGDPSVVTSYPVKLDSNECAGYMQDMPIAELRRTQKVCMYGDERLKIGYFSDGGPYRGVVGFPYSGEMHVLNGICNDIPCRYSADQDMLVTQQQVSAFGWGAVVYKHVSERIKRVPGQTSQYGFVFDSSSPDYVVANTTGKFLWTPTYAISDNGKWLVVELREKGFAVINTDTFESRHISTLGFGYGYGMDPTLQLAISDDGKSVAIMGQNAGFEVIDVVPGCGQELIDELNRQPETINCPSSDIGVVTVFPNFYFATQPHFFGSGQQLEVTVISWWMQPTQRATFLAHGAEPVHKLKLLALGDSFTSGEGETDASYYEPGTNEPFESCHVSKRSYPLLIASMMGIGTADAKSVACAGARIGDIIGSAESYWGQASRLGVSGLKLSPAQKVAAQEEALHNFQPGRALQSSFMERYDPETIIVGVGGNDAGLMGKLKVCAMPGTCEWAREEGKKATAGEIKRLFDTLVTLLMHISQHQPNAKVFVAGYPNIIEADGACDPVTGLLLDRTERVFIQESVTYLNRVIQAAAQKVGFTYIDIEKALEGNSLCSSSSVAAMNGLRFGDDIAVIPALPMIKIIGAETFHPTPYGHSLIANSIAARYPGLSQPALCSTDPMPCGPIGIEALSYWDVQNQEANRQAYAANMIASHNEPSRQLDIEMPGGAFEPSSTVKVEVHSDSLQLGELLTNPKGGVLGAVTIPEDIEIGFHTLHLLGTSREGRLIDIYQVIAAEKDEQGEITVNTIDTPREGAAPLNVPERLSGLPGFDTAAAVLGNSISQQVAKADLGQAIQVVRQQLKNNWTIVVVVLITSLVILLTLITLLVRRRWAKSSS